MSTTHANTQSPLSAPRDIGAARLAKVYAQAIVEAADRQQCREAVIEELTQLVTEVLPRVDNLIAVLESPRVSVADKASIVNSTLAGKVSTTTLNVLLVLAQHDRLSILPEIVAAVRREVDRREGRHQAVLTTASPIEPNTQSELLRSIEQSLGVSLAATFAVNPDLLGGLVVRVEDTVYDHSVATSLVSLAERLKQRSIHEIQHRRDRLGTA
jgi:F-type H+-transporting ATPase subunit delta